MLGNLSPFIIEKVTDYDYSQERIKDKSFTDGLHYNLLVIESKECLVFKLIKLIIKHINSVLDDGK